MSSTSVWHIPLTRSRSRPHPLHRRFPSKTTQRTKQTKWTLLNLIASRPAARETREKRKYPQVQSQIPRLLDSPLFSLWLLSFLSPLSFKTISTLHQGPSVQVQRQYKLPIADCHGSCDSSRCASSNDSSIILKLRVLRDTSHTTQENSRVAYRT